MTDVIKQIQGVLVKAGILDHNRAREESGSWSAYTALAWAAGMRQVYPDSPEAHRASLNAQPMTLRASVRHALLALAPPKPVSEKPPKAKRKKKAKIMATEDNKNAHTDNHEGGKVGTETSNPISPPQDGSTAERGKTVGSNVEKGDNKK